MLIKAWTFENSLSDSQWGMKVRNPQVSQITLKSQGDGLENLLTSFPSSNILITYIEY